MTSPSETEQPEKTPEETPAKSKRLLGLDALRGIAVFLMIEQHLGAAHVHQQRWQPGQVGVDGRRQRVSASPGIRNEAARARFDGAVIEIVVARIASKRR